MNTKKGTTYQRESRVKAAMARTGITIGTRFGGLEVTQALGARPVGSRATIFWKCLCDCGSTLELPTIKLRGSRASAPYTGCETCSQKTCFLCGERYSRRRRYDFCASPACIEAMVRERGRDRQERLKKRRATDPQWREAINERQREQNAKNPGQTWAWFQALSPERRVQVEEDRRNADERYLKRIYSDPDRYQEHRARMRPIEAQSKHRSAQNAMLEDAQQLLRKTDDNS